MENASKALIIAGAILISILLISVGIIIMNAINEPVQEGANTAASQAVEIFNSKFSGYSGTKMEYATARQCITAIQSSNGAGANEITIGGSYTTIGTLERGQKYDIDFKDSNGDGYYDQCSIVKTGETAVWPK